MSNFDNINIKQKNVLTYDDLFNRKPGKSKEPLVEVNRYNPSIIAKYMKKDMLPIVGEKIYVRDSVAKKLARIEEKIQDKGYDLYIVYGYRHPEVQAKYFKEIKDTLKKQRPDLKGKALDEYAHIFIAVPDAAGHPAGAALDMTIAFNGKPIDMGAEIADFDNEEKMATYAKGLTDKQIKNRKMLHDLMVEEGFAPFYGEWWHFSYGDREWAAFYDKETLYAPIDFRTKK